jgi:hypothetical protein
MKQKPYKSVTIPLDEELAYQVEQVMIAYGLDSRGQAAAALVRAGASAVAGDAFMASVLTDQLREFREGEAAALAKFYEERAKLFRTR